MKIPQLLSIISLSLLFTLPPLQAENSSLVYDLDDTVQIVLALMQGDNLTAMLEDSSPDEVELLLKNFSPAEFAWEVEISNVDVPIAVLFYEKETARAKALESTFEELSVMFENKLKCITVDANTLFRLAELTEVTQLPTMVLLYDHQEIGRLEENLDNEALKEVLQQFLDRFLSEKESE